VGITDLLLEIITLLTAVLISIIILLRTNHEPKPKPNQTNQM
jgi:hypothetical protein